MLLEDFYAEVLQKLGVLAAEEPPPASDRLAAKVKYEQVHAEFSRRELVPWFDDEDVPEWIADGFAALVASRLVSEFSLPQARRLELKVEALAGVDTLVADGQRRALSDAQASYY